MLSPNTLLQNRYIIVRPIGQGGMGTVYEAKALRLNTTVALKEAHFTDERLRKQFEREAQLLAGLRHPALPRVIDHFDEGDGLFLVMDFIEGEDLGQMLEHRSSTFPVNEVLIWADQLLEALDYLHSQEPPVIHRDIKPQNLKLTAKGQIILLDFGLAKGFAGQISRVTTSGSIFGYTPNYAPLEQIQGTGTDPRSDLYSLAATLYRMVTGEVPPDVLTRLAALTEGQPDPLRSAHEANPQVPASLAAVLSRALGIGRNQRFATAAEMRQALRAANRPQIRPSGQTDTETSSPAQRARELQPTVASPTAASPTAAAPASLPESPRVITNPQLPDYLAQSARRPNRLPWIIGIVALIGISITIIAIIAALLSNRSNPQQTEANQQSAAQRGSDANARPELTALSPSSANEHLPTPRGQRATVTPQVLPSPNVRERGNDNPDAASNSEADDGRAQAIATVRSILQARATSCRLSMGNISATRIPRGWRVIANVTTSGHPGTSLWNVINGRATAADPLAADIRMGCP